MTPALERGLKVLELLAEEEAELNLKSISQKLQIPAPSLWRIMTTLKSRGYVIYDPVTKMYRLGFKFLYLGNILLNKMGFRSHARGHLKELVALTGETAELSARVKDQLILIDQVEGPEAVRLFSRIGSAYPYFHATAPGKIYLAHMDEEKLSRVIEQIGLPKITPYTITDPRVLKKQLLRIRQKGYASDSQEMRIGVSRIASAVYNRYGKIEACLGIAGPSFRITARRLDQLGQQVMKIAKKLSKELSQLPSEEGT
ncbi:MAG: hypothetical protein DRG63_04690 [Deltaproteobacteria bacterium]|nr:MAG: hypothetical protein DRG63_04690 [Deltaproteobacteria bacterium]